MYIVTRVKRFQPLKLRSFLEGHYMGKGSNFGKGSVFLEITVVSLISQFLFDIYTIFVLSEICCISYFSLSVFLAYFI